MRVRFVNPETLYMELQSYFPIHADLMKFLDINACWEYCITNDDINDVTIKLHFFLQKKDENSLIMTRQDSNIKSDLILYFTEKAILQLIEGNPSAEEYFHRYHEIMNNPKLSIEVDNKVNKPRLVLWKLGYKKWQAAFKF
jgi:hypothetical protein